MPAFSISSYCFIQIIITVYSYIFKYWLHLENCENKLLKESHKINVENYQNDKSSWVKIVEYLLKFTDFNVTQDKSAKELTLRFRNKIKTIFEKWWEDQANVTGQNKLDFYYKYKRTFKYEEYLDNVHKTLRMPITRLRLSSHNLPIETLRYHNIERKERKCQICKLDEMGDEEHYLKRCKNNKINDVRTQFITKIKTFPQFTFFSEENIIDYCMNMKDHIIQKSTAFFVKNISKAYREESNVPPLHIICNKFIKKNMRVHHQN